MTSEGKRKTPPDNRKDDKGNRLLKDSDSPEEELGRCPIHDKPLEQIPAFVASDTDAVEGETFLGCVECVLSRQNRESNEKINVEFLKKNPLIQTFTPEISKNTNVPEFVARASLEFLIAFALKDCFFRTNKGRVRGNVAFRHVGESGHDKSTIFNWMRYSIIPKAFSDFDYYVVGSGTVKGFSKHFERDRKKHGDRQIPILLMKDEDNSLYEDSRSNKINDVFQGFSNLYNGFAPSNTTVTNDHVNEKRVYCCMWTNGTPSSLDREGEERWTQGFGWRQLILLDRNRVQELPITSKSLSDMEAMNAKIITALKEIKKIRRAETTPEFEELLNKYYRDELRKKNEIEAKGEEIRLTLEWAEVEATTKIPEHLIKLSMISAASRGNIDEQGTLILDVKDMEYAVEQFWDYVSKNIQFFTLWTQKRTTANISANIEKISQIMKALKDEGHSFDLEYNKEEDAWIVIEDKGGWIKHSALLKRSKLPATGYNSFESVIDTMIEREEIQKRTGRIYKTVQAGRIPLDVTFYRFK